MLCAGSQTDQPCVCHSELELHWHQAIPADASQVHNNQQLLVVVRHIEKRKTVVDSSDAAYNRSMLVFIYNGRLHRC